MQSAMNAQLFNVVDDASLLVALANLLHHAH
jgi:hypothetical protein